MYVYIYIRIQLQSRKASVWFNIIQNVSVAIRFWHNCFTLPWVGPKKTLASPCRVKVKAFGYWRVTKCNSYSCGLTVIDGFISWFTTLARGVMIPIATVRNLMFHNDVSKCAPWHHCYWVNYGETESLETIPRNITEISQLQPHSYGIINPYILC